MPALIPWQGPFHVALNAEESTQFCYFGPSFPNSTRQYLAEKKIPEKATS